MVYISLSVLSKMAPTKICVASTCTLIYVFQSTILIIRALTSIFIGNF